MKKNILTTMKILLLLSIFSLLESRSNAQNHDNIWYVGSGVGLDFSNCQPSVISDFVNDNNPLEGNVAISDNDGQLLFYSNGYLIYDNTHQVMSGGNPVSLANTMTQNVIVPKPGTNNIYYLITPDVQGGSVYNINYPNAKGINFAEIDMSGNGGLGVVTSKFNILKLPSNCEKLCVVTHQNNTDYWVIGHEYGNSNFFVFEVTNSGISGPSIQNVGPIINTPQNNIAGSSNFDAIGELRASPDRSKIAFTSYYNGITGIFDFDNSTGIISNPIELDLEGEGGYGISFSPDNSKLYVTSQDSSVVFENPYNDGNLYQFDISSGIQSTIQLSKSLVYSCPDCVLASLKIGPDGKLYVAQYGELGNLQGNLYIGCVEEPNQLPPSCQYNHQAVYLNGKRGCWALNNLFERTTFCTELNTQDLQINERQVVKIIDPMGREIFNQTNTIVLYIYSDGSVERVFQIE